MEAVRVKRSDTAAVIKDTNSTTAISISLTNTENITTANSSTPVVLTGSMWTSMGTFFQTCQNTTLGYIEIMLAQDAVAGLIQGVIQNQIETVLIANAVGPEVGVPIAGILLVGDATSVVGQIEAAAI